MTNGNDVLEFEQGHYEKLCKEFIQNNINEWNEFVIAEFNNFEQHKNDMEFESLYDTEMDGHDYYVDC